MMPFSNATSPLMRTCRNRSASFVPLPSQVQNLLRMFEARHARLPAAG